MNRSGLKFFFCRENLHLSSSAPNGEAVVFVHGLGRTGLSMLVPAFFFRKRNYDSFIFNYFSSRNTVAASAKALAKFADDILLANPAIRKLNFFTHSLGGILVGIALKDFSDARIGRIVMIAPPSRGSATANSVSKIPLVTKILVPLAELKNDSGLTAKCAALPKIEIGVIAGRYDGKVSLEESHFEGEKDHLIVNGFHSFLMNRKDVLEASLNFLRRGSFR